MALRGIRPATAPLDAELRAAPSKSATHRALVAAALAEGISEIHEPLDAADTRRTLRGLESLGVAVDARERVWYVHGTSGRPPGGGRLQLGASGTSARFLTALAAVGAKSSSLDGDARLRERPIAELVEALGALGARIEAAPGPALPIRAGGAPVRGGPVVVPGARSSQFASALLLAAPAFERGIDLAVSAPRASVPYTGLTVAMLRAFGAVVEERGEGRYAVPPQALRATRLTIEGDHSSSSYFLAAAAILGGRVRIHGLSAESAQPDVRFLDDLASLGCGVKTDAGGVLVEAGGRVPAFAWNLTDAPDLAPTAAVLALFADGTCALSGLDHLAFKESHRAEVLSANLSRLGARVVTGEGLMSIEPPPRAPQGGVTIDTAGDHRIAMAFAVAGLAGWPVTVDDADVVAKSYPGFWDDLERLVRTGS